MDYFGLLFGGLSQPGTGRRHQKLATTPPALVDGDALEAAQQAAGPGGVPTLDELFTGTTTPLPTGEPRIIDIDYEEVP